MSRNHMSVHVFLALSQCSLALSQCNLALLLCDLALSQCDLTPITVSDSSNMNQCGPIQPRQLVAPSIPILFCPARGEAGRLAQNCSAVKNCICN